MHLLIAVSLALVLSAGPAGAAVDSTKWGFDVGWGGWGNKELEFYTNGTRNASTDGAGNLRIVAFRETPARKVARCWYGRCQYTSARPTL